MGLNHTLTDSGSIVSWMTRTSSAVSASKSVSLRTVAAKASNVFSALYLRRKKRRSMASCTRRRSGKKSAAIKQRRKDNSDVRFACKRRQKPL